MIQKSCGNVKYLSSFIEYIFKKNMMEILKSSSLM